MSWEERVTRYERYENDNTEYGYVIRCYFVSGGGILEKIKRDGETGWILYNNKVINNPENSPLFSSPEGAISYWELMRN